MKAILLAVVFCLLAICFSCRHRPAPAPRTAELACGQCQFGMAGTNCDLAVRLAGKAYFVSGFHIDQFGDAHATNGFCNAIRQARVIGRVEHDRFVAEKIELR